MHPISQGVWADDVYSPGENVLEEPQAVGGFEDIYEGPFQVRAARIP